MTDVFPQPNVSDLSMPWARAHDVRVIEAENGLEALRQSVSGQNRNTASSLQEISRLIEGLQATVDQIPITRVFTASETEFTPLAALTDPNWTPVCSANITVPGGATRMSLMCNSFLRVYIDPVLDVTLVRSRIVMRRVGGGYSFAGASMDAPRVDSPFGDYYPAAPFLANEFTPHPNGYTLTLEVASNGGAVPESTFNFGQIAATATFNRD